MPKKYSCEKLAQGVGSVRRGHLTISQASREYRVPRMTESGHVKQPHMRTTTGPPLQLSDEDTRAFKDCALLHPAALPSYQRGIKSVYSGSCFQVG